MRYLKVLILAVFLFLALIFFFQNQAPLSQQMEMTLNLFFIPPMTSISLPFYFLVVAAFFIGCILTLFWLAWDKLISSSKLMKSKWEVKDLKKQVDRLQRLLDKAAVKAEEEERSDAAAPKALAPATAPAFARSDAPADEQGGAKKD